MNEIGQEGSKNLLCRSATDHLCFLPFHAFTFFLHACIFELRDSRQIEYHKNYTWKKLRRLSSVVWYGNPPTNILVNMVSLCEGVICAVRWLNGDVEAICIQYDVHSSLEFTKMLGLSDCCFAMEISRFTKWRVVPWSLSKKKKFLLQNQLVTRISHHFKKSGTINWIKVNRQYLRLWWCGTTSNNIYCLLCMCVTYKCLGGRAVTRSECDDVFYLHYSQYWRWWWGRPFM